MSQNPLLYIFMRTILFYLFLAVGFVLVLYLSWLYESKIGSSWLVPGWLAEWVDATENDTIRTGVPFVFLGLVIGGWLRKKGKAMKKWLLLLVLVLIAELGQLFLPLRIFDWRDVAWGSGGAAFGIGIIAFLWGIQKLINKK